MVVRTHCNSNPDQKLELEPKLIFPGLAYSRSTTVLPSITQTFCRISIFFLFPIKRKCVLRSTRIENSRYLMKNQKYWYFVRRYPMMALEIWWHFFLEIFFWTPQKKIKIKKVKGPAWREKHQKLAWQMPSRRLCSVWFASVKTLFWA